MLYYRKCSCYGLLCYCDLDNWIYYVVLIYGFFFYNGVVNFDLWCLLVDVNVLVCLI